MNEPINAHPVDHEGRPIEPDAMSLVTMNDLETETPYACTVCGGRPAPYSKWQLLYEQYPKKFGQACSDKCKEAFTNA